MYKNYRHVQMYLFSNGIRNAKIFDAFVDILNLSDAKHLEKSMTNIREQ